MMCGRQFLAIAAALSLSVSSARAVCTRTYTVKSGDSCNAIAVSQGVSLYQITFVNAANACNNLQIGQSLCLATDTYNCQPVYTVKGGDTCTNIATSHSIGLSQFLADNPNLDPNTCPIQIGMSVCVSRTTPGSTTTGTPTTTSTTSAPTTTGSCTRTYTVKSGDNCNAIAVEQGVSLYQLQLLNANACNNLQIGQVLCLASSSYNCQPVYTVKNGDTCSNIATSHGISLATFLADNPNLDPSTCPIQVGMSVCVSPNTPGTPTSTTTATTTTTSTSSTPTSTACTKFGTVQAGDSCEAIAQRDKISTYFLQLINPPNTCANLISGASICIDSPLNDCSSVYTVTGSEGGCANIASSNGITVDALYALNPNVNAPSCNNIFPGEVLCVAPRSAGPPPPPDDCTREATIVIGDTCTNFAARASLTNLQLAGLNPGLNCNALIPGRMLCTFSLATSICPGLVKVAVNDTCFSLAQKVHMSLDEWEGLNAGIDCAALLPGSVVCSAEGNATLPSQPSGTNPTALPLCGNYDKKTNCCTQWSVSADLHSDLCQRANGCQDNCVGDATVTVPPSAGTPTTTIVTTDYPLPTPPPNSGCDSCTSSQCCTLGNVCQDIDSWFCESANGCISNCDQGPPPGVNLPWQAVLADANYTFPSGDYSATDGNPCGICNADNALAPSPNGQYCCSQDIQCVPVGYTDCLVSLGCTYNCIKVTVDYDACEDGNCTPSTTTVLRPFAT